MYDSPTCCRRAEIGHRPGAFELTQDATEAPPEYPNCAGTKTRLRLCRLSPDKLVPGRDMRRLPQVRSGRASPCREPDRQHLAPPWYRQPRGALAPGRFGQKSLKRRIVRMSERGF